MKMLLSVLEHKLFRYETLTIMQKRDHYLRDELRFHLDYRIPPLWPGQEKRRVSPNQGGSHFPRREDINGEFGLKVSLALALRIPFFYVPSEFTLSKYIRDTAYKLACSDTKIIWAISQYINITLSCSICRWWSAS